MLFLYALLSFVLRSSVAANPVMTPHIFRRGNIMSKGAVSKPEAPVDVAERINGFWFTRIKVVSTALPTYGSHIPG